MVEFYKNRLVANGYKLKVADYDEGSDYAHLIFSRNAKDCSVILKKKKNIVVIIKSLKNIIISSHLLCFFGLIYINIPINGNIKNKYIDLANNSSNKSISSACRNGSKYSNG